jgi:hypothetical protein
VAVRDANRRAAAERRALHPPTLKTTIQFTHRFRWVSRNATNDYENLSSITAAQLLRLLVQGQSLGGSASIIRSVRIRDAEIWGTAVADVTGNNSNYPATVYLEYPNSSNLGLGGPDIRKSDTSIGTAIPAHVRYPPPRGSLASMWLNDSSNVVIAIFGPRNSILDLTLDIVLEDTTNVKTAGTTGAATAANYLLAIDHGGGGYFWVPQSYSTTT